MKRPPMWMKLTSLLALASFILPLAPKALADANQEILKKIWGQAGEVELKYNTFTGRTLEIQELIGQPRETQKLWERELRGHSLRIDQLGNNGGLNQIPVLDCVHIVCQEK